MAKFIAKGTVKYNGVNYTTGTVFEVKEEHVDEFKKYGWEIVDEEAAGTDDEEGTNDAGEGTGEAGEGEGQEGQVGDPQPIDYSKLTNAQLKELLDEKEIKYSANANKAELLALLG